MHVPNRTQLQLVDRTGSNVVPEHARQHMALDPPPGLFTQPSQTQEPSQQPARQPLDLRKTAAITVAIANVQIRDDEMATSQEGPSNNRAPSMLQRLNSSSTRQLTVEVVPRMPSQDMW